MRKLTLDVDSLRVESFDPDPAARGRGTVDGNAAETELACPSGTFRCSLNDAVTCARRRTDCESCYVNCECTNFGVKCLPEY